MMSKVILVLGAVCISLSSAGVLSGLHAPAVYSAGLPLAQAYPGPAHVVSPLNVALPASPLVLSSPAQVPYEAIQSVVATRSAVHPPLGVVAHAAPIAVAAPVAYAAAPVAYAAAPVGGW